MERIDDQNQNSNAEMSKRWEGDHKRGKIFGGLIIVGIGCLLLAREMGAYLPHWLFTWKMLLIVIGSYVLVKHSFRHIGGFIMILIGSAFILRDYYSELDFTHYLWPVVLIMIGLYVILRPHRSWHRHHYRRWSRHQRWSDSPAIPQAPTSSDDYIEVSAVFGSIKKNVISKNFKGGEVNSVFGGTEINLTQAEFKGAIELEVNSVFGGTRLIVPPHWEIKSKCDAVCGSVEDKRPIQMELANGENVLMLKGSAVFGGIEIRSF